MDKKSSVLVIFTDKIGAHWQDFETVVGPQSLQGKITGLGVKFVDIATLVDPGSVHEAAELTRKLSLIKNAKGVPLPKSVIYRGFELWWIHYNDFMHQFCLPYTQFHRLLAYMADFKEVQMYHPPFPSLFKLFLSAYKVDFKIVDKYSRALPSFGAWFQFLASIAFVPWLVAKRSQVLVWTSDQFDKQTDYDFRMAYIYKELRNRKIPFVECIRSLEPLETVINHAVRRRRPVVYSHAIVTVLHFLAHVTRRGGAIDRPETSNPDEHFWLTVATYYLRNVRGAMWSIQSLKCILKIIGVKVAIIDTASSRSLHEIIAAKLLGIPVIGIQHGGSLRQYNVSDYMPGFSGERSLGVDAYGVWSEWWREYHVKYSSLYKPEEIHVAGPMRPLDVKKVSAVPLNPSDKLKVLFISEELAAPEEAVPYLGALLEDKDIATYVKFRFYRDGFEEWLVRNRPELYERIDKDKILKSSMDEAIALTDIAVGCRSNGVVEALLQTKPFVFFNTNKWGDYFELKSFDSSYKFFAENQSEFLHLVKVNKNIPESVLNELRERFFGKPGQNGSKWVVDKVEKLLR